MDSENIMIRSYKIMLVHTQMKKKQRKKMLQDLKDKKKEEKNLLFPKGLFETTTAK